MNVSETGRLPTTEGRSAPLRIRRRNRKWMVLMMLTPVVLGATALLAVFTSGPPEPSVKPVIVPSGYRAITDAYFGYAVPASWKENDAFTDGNGDFLYQGAGGWVGESLTVRATSPDPAAPPPKVVSVFGEAQYVPVAVTARRPVGVPHAGYAWRYDLSRGDGSRAIALDVWIADSQTEMWLVIDATPDITSRIASSLQSYAIAAQS